MNELKRSPLKLIVGHVFVYGIDEWLINYCKVYRETFGDDSMEWIDKIAGLPPGYPSIGIRTDICVETFQESECE